MLKISIIVGNNADFAYNRLLAKFVAKRYQQKAKMQILEIKSLPLFAGQKLPAEVKDFRQEISNSDGLIICTPEYDRAIPASLKNALEWVGHFSGTDIMKYKPVMVIGTALSELGSSNAQEDLREILLSPDLAANVFPGNEILIGHAQNSFDTQSGLLTNHEATEELDRSITDYFNFIRQ